MDKSLRTRILAAVALLALLLQVQLVFACETMEHSGPLSECCCGAVAKAQEPDCDCCTLDSRVSFKSDAEEQQSALPAQFALELPQLAAPPRAQWPPILAPPAVRSTETHETPSRPGNRTWLATLRLRI